MGVLLPPMIHADPMLRILYSEFGKLLPTILIDLLVREAGKSAGLVRIAGGRLGKCFPIAIMSLDQVALSKQVANVGSEG